jgi:general secretion pathway protein I
MRERSLASFSADNAMALVRIEPQRMMAETSTSDCPQADLNFSCTVRTGPTPNPALRRIEVEVVLPDDLSHPLARRLAFFSTFK